MTTLAAADNTVSADAQARYQQERAVCLSGQSNQDRATCLREADAALADGQERWPRGRLAGVCAQRAPALRATAR
jgi:hypothetical protein